MMTRLYILADDSMMGRSAATRVQCEGCALHRARDQAIAGSSRRARTARTSSSRSSSARSIRRPRITVGGTAATRSGPSSRRAIRVPGRAAFDGATVVYAGSLGDPQHLLPPSAVAGKIALLTSAKDSAGRANFNVNRGQLTRRISRRGRDRGRDDGRSSRRATSTSSIASRKSSPKGLDDSRPLPNYFYVSKAVARAMLGRDAESAQPGAQGGTVQRADSVRREGSTGAERRCASSPVPIRRCAASTSRSARITTTSASTPIPPTTTR